MTLLRQRCRWLPARLFPALLLGALAAGPAWAQRAPVVQPSPEAGSSAVPEAWNAYVQTTYIWQKKWAFPAAYSGTNSLRPNAEKSYSFTATAFLGLRLWQGAEFYYNPEAAQGVPLSGLLGLGGMTNGEMARTTGPTLVGYNARAFLRQTIDLGGETAAVASEANQLAGNVASRRMVVSVGKVAMGDIFDENRYAHDPRNDFMNWAIITHGAYDYAADARGYSLGFAAEYFDPAGWAIRAGRFAMPKESNGLPLDPSLTRQHGDQVELEINHGLFGRPGTVRFLAFRNKAGMGSFRASLDLAAATGTTPDLALTRQTRYKTGFGINIEQPISDELGAFFRGSWADGKSETFSYAEIDNSIAGGIVLQGNRWGRANDRIGAALVRNGLSRDRRDYLAAGGLGFFLGDGALNYRPEQILETFYAAQLCKGFTVSLNYQYIRNPAYNADRGPVNVAAIRLHAEY